MLEELACPSFEAGDYTVGAAAIPGDGPRPSISASVRAMSVSVRTCAPETPNDVAGGGGNGTDVLGHCTTKVTISEQGEPSNSVTLVTFGLCRSHIAKDSARLQAVALFLHSRELR